MLYKDVIKIAEERVRLETAEQITNLHQEIESIKRKAAAIGAINSGPFLNQIKDLCALTIKNRAQLVWQTFFRFFMTTGISYSETLANELKSMVAVYLPEDMFKNLLRQNAELTRQPNLFTHLGPQLDAARCAALVKVGTEIDLFVYSLRKKVEMKEREAASTIFNIYSPVGAIQTGNSSIANFTQNIDTDVRDQLTKALEEISLKLAQSDFAMPYPKEEIIGIIHESQKELENQSPNITKLGCMLSTVGTAIQTIASMQPAYAALKYALTFFGISLP